MPGENGVLILMARIAVVLDDMFEDAEFTEPRDAFEDEGHDTVIVGKRRGKRLKGKKKGTEATVDKVAEEVSVAEFDALLIPGGYSPDKLRTDDKIVEFVKLFTESKKPVFSICHGPQLLITADVLRGRRLTGWKSIYRDVINAGGDFVDKEVVVDDNLVSSRSPRDLPAFIRESLKKL
mgnify:CR=1 FL=1